MLFFLIANKNPSSNQKKHNKKVTIESSNELVKKENSLDKIKNQINSKINTEGQSVNFHQIQFLKDDDQISQESEVYLNEVIKILNEIPKLKLLIVGHTSSEGDESYNLKLSEKRAIAVSKYLQNKGIIESRLSTKGEGANKPLSDNGDESSRSLNRRIEFIVIEDGIENN